MPSSARPSRLVQGPRRRRSRPADILDPGLEEPAADSHFVLTNTTALHGDRLPPVRSQFSTWMGPAWVADKPGCPAFFTDVFHHHTNWIGSDLTARPPGGRARGRAQNERGRLSCSLMPARTSTTTSTCRSRTRTSCGPCRRRASDPTTGRWERSKRIRSRPGPRLQTARLKAACRPDRLRPPGRQRSPRSPRATWSSRPRPADARPSPAATGCCATSATGELTKPADQLAHDDRRADKGAAPRHPPRPPDRPRGRDTSTITTIVVTIGLLVAFVSLAGIIAAGRIDRVLPEFFSGDRCRSWGSTSSTGAFVASDGPAVSVAILLR